MSGMRDMFNILNTQINDWALSTELLHHTGGCPSHPRWQICLRFKHFQHLGVIVAPHYCCTSMDLPGSLLGHLVCQ